MSLMHSSKLSCNQNIMKLMFVAEFYQSFNCSYLVTTKVFAVSSDDNLSSKTDI